VNGATGVGTTVRDVLTILHEAFPGVPPLVFNAQHKAGDPTAYIGECSKALAWGWCPSIRLRDGISEYAQWFQRGCR
jgi:UDP-glucose 4-epimerase